MSEYIITKEQIEELNRVHGGMKIATSWLSCYAIWDTSNTYPVMKSEHVAVDLPEIVRCEDCKHWRRFYPESEQRFGTCRAWRYTMRFDGYCHNASKVEGERKSE